MSLEKSIRHAAVRLLARREHSRRELIIKLNQRGFQTTDIQPVLDWLEQNDLLSHERFVNMIVRVRSRKGIGPVKIIAELKSHDISQKLIDADEDWQALDWVAIARGAKIKKFGEDKPSSALEQAKQTQYLIKRGFLREHIEFG